MRVLDLFSGIGSYALGLQRAGMTIAAFCEIEEYPRKILRRHWPDVRIYDDVRTLDAATLRRDGIAVDVVCGGWPCQDISPAGTGSGLDGARSGLWAEVARIAGDVRPSWLVLENSSNLLAINGGRDFGRVLGDLAALGYDVEWHCLPAAAFDAPHIRDRLWIVANRARTAADTHDSGQHAVAVDGEMAEARGVPSATDADAAGNGRRAGRSRRAAAHDEGRTDTARNVAYADQGGWIGRPRTFGKTRWRGQPAHSSSAAHPHGHAAFGSAIARRQRHTWEPEPDVVRVVHGAPNRVERIRALGNLNPPIVPELIGRAIMEASRA